MIRIQICVLLFIAPPLLAQNSDWLIRITGGGEIENAALLGLEGDSVAVSSPSLNGKLHVKWISRLSRGGGHAAVGGFVGGIIGGATGYFIGSRSDDSGPNYSSNDTDPEVQGMLIGGGVGLVFGVLSGQMSGREVFKLDQKSYEDKLATMRVVLSKEGRLIDGETRQKTDIVYLKNGSIIRGSVIELFPDSTVRILTPDSSLFVFAMTEVSRISKGMISPTIRSVKEEQPVPANLAMDQRFRFSLCAGLGAPVGEFGKTSGSSGGAANSGFTFGGELSYALNRSTAWVTSLYYSANSIDESALGLPSGIISEVGSWTMFWPMTGMKISSDESGDLQFYGLAQVGLLAASSPEIKASGGNVLASQSSSTGTSVSFSIGAGVTSASHLMFWARYITGEPEYEYTAVATGQAGSYSNTVKGKQPMSLFLIGLGYTF